MKKVCLIAALIFTCNPIALANEPNQPKLAVTLDVRYMTSYVWYGFDIFAKNHSAIIPSALLDFWQTGFAAQVESIRANGSGFENKELFNIRLFYNGKAFERQPHEIDYSFRWVYYSHPDTYARHLDIQVAYAVFRFPNILPGGIIPIYKPLRVWPAKSNSGVKRKLSGWGHVFGLDYPIKLKPIIPNTDHQLINLHAETIYNDSVGPCPVSGKRVDHDWSHALFSISSPFYIKKNLSFTPTIYYQSSWEDTVNPSDEFFTMLQLTYMF